MKIATVRGISVYIHWTFWILIGFYLVTISMSGGLAAGLFAVAFISSVFACVVAHEFGHAAAAAHYGIRTSDITLLPIGGVARLTRLPDTPLQELVIAVAGPAVNVLIAVVLVLLIASGLLPSGLPEGRQATFAFFDYVLMANIILVLFNMLPAFPMDGGRVLRSLLAMRTGQLRATEIAARVGRWMALLFAIFAIYYGELMLLLVAGFVFLAGTAELMAVRVRAMASEMGGPSQPAASPFGGSYVRWQSNMWPQQATSYRWPEMPQPPSYAGADDVIDAVDVRRIPPKDPSH